MTQDKATDLSLDAEEGGRKPLERLLLGENSITGTLRLIGYMLVFAVLFGTLFHLLG